MTSKFFTYAVSVLYNSRATLSRCNFFFTSEKENKYSYNPTYIHILPYAFRTKYPLT